MSSRYSRTETIDRVGCSRFETRNLNRSVVYANDDEDGGAGIGGSGGGEDSSFTTGLC